MGQSRAPEMLRAGLIAALLGGGACRAVPCVGGVGGCGDVDGDGYAVPEDCDDLRDEVHPGQTEVCGNNRDDDCDPTTRCPGRPDFNGDGFLDIPVASPGEVVGGLDAVGVLRVLYGSAAGPATGDIYRFTQGTGEADPTEPYAGDRVGATHAWGDLDGDGHDDLVVAAPYDDVIDGGFPLWDVGRVVIVYGGPDGLGAHDQHVVDLRSLTLPGGGGHHLRHSRSRAGMAILVEDMGPGAGDGVDDLILGSPGGMLWDAPACSVHILYGSLSSPGGAKPKPGSQRRDLVTCPEGTAAGVSATKLPGIHDPLFGTALAAGDFDGDGVKDLAVGAPGVVDPFIYVTFGPEFGPQPKVEALSESGVARPGMALVACDLDGDAIDDLLVGHPTYDGDGHPPGLVGLRGGLRMGAGIFAGPQRQLDVRGSRTDGDPFGALLWCGDLDADGYSDVLAGGDSGAGHVGQITTFLGGADLFDGADSEAGPAEDAASAAAVDPLPASGVLAPPESIGDVFVFGFGASVMVADFDGDDRSDLIAAASRSEVAIAGGTARLDEAGALVLAVREGHGAEWDLENGRIMTGETIGLDPTAGAGFGRLPGFTEGAAYGRAAAQQDSLDFVEERTGSVGAYTYAYFVDEFHPDESFRAGMSMLGVSWQADGPVPGHEDQYGSGVEGRVFLPHTHGFTHPETSLDGPWAGSRMGVRKLAGPGVTPWDCAGLALHGAPSMAQAGPDADGWDAFEFWAGPAGIEGEWGDTPPGARLCVVVDQASGGSVTRYSTIVTVDGFNVNAFVGTWVHPEFSGIPVCFDRADVSWSTRRLTPRPRR